VINKIIIPNEQYNGTINHVYAIIAYKKQNQEKLLQIQGIDGVVRCVSADRSEIYAWYDKIKKQTKGNITLVISKFTLREDHRVEFGDVL